MAEKSTVTLLAVGDIDPATDPADKFADFVADDLKNADLRFAQCERVFSDLGWPEFGWSWHKGGQITKRKPHMASIFKKTGIDIVSLASNHSMDWGPDALLDTSKLFRSMGMQVIGAGIDGAEAHAPAIVERNGVKIAVLAYCSVVRAGHQAEGTKPGMAPLRVRTYTYQDEWQAGMPPHMITEPHEGDVRAMVEDIKKAKEKADVVIVSHHWGIHHLPKVIADYQPMVAHAAIDAGADLILGHHPHVIKAVELYKGKICFYSIGNFIHNGTIMLDRPAARQICDLWWFKPDPDCIPPVGNYLFPPDARMTMMVKLVMSKQGIDRVSFFPTFINGHAQPAVVRSGDPNFQRILDYTEWVSDQFPHKFHVEGEEIVIDTKL